MGAQKLSISFDPETIDRARQAAARAGMPLSTWIDRAARRAADLDEARAAVEDHFAVHGEPSEADRTWARDTLAAAGVGPAQLSRGDRSPPRRTRAPRCHGRGGRRMRVLHPRQLLLDAGALRHAEKHPRGRVWALCEAELAEGRQPLLPVTVLARMWRGGARQGGSARVVKLCRPVPIDGALARRIGILLGASGTTDIVDAMVVLAAVEEDAAVVTSDPGDLEKPASALGVVLPLLVVQPSRPTPHAGTRHPAPGTDRRRRSRRGCAAAHGAVTRPTSPAAPRRHLQQ